MTRPSCGLPSSGPVSKIRYHLKAESCIVSLLGGVVLQVPIGSMQAWRFLFCTRLHVVHQLRKKTSNMYLSIDSQALF